MTFFRRACTVSRAMTRDPMAAWIATSNIWRGIIFCIFSTSVLPRWYEVSELHQGRDPVAAEVIVERGVPLRRRLQAVGQRRLAVVDVGDDREVADVLH